MLSLNLENLGFDLVQDKLTKSFTEVRSAVLSGGHGFMDLPSDQVLLDQIDQFLAKLELGPNKYTDIVLLGIGGSSLGPKCIYEALGKSSDKRVYIIDNIDPDEIARVEQLINWQSSLFLVITKSGSTPETIATYLHFRERLLDQNLNLSEHLLFITDPEIGYLRKIALLENIPSFAIPENVGGRFSVLSAVGLVFAGLIGVDYRELLHGANQINQEFLQAGDAGDLAWKLALAQYRSSLQNRPILVIMPYASSLRAFGDWFTQLLSESIGKELNQKGEKVKVGLTPLPALGATDQHSMLQLLKEGPDDKLILFVKVNQFFSKQSIPKTEEEKFHYLSGKTFQELLLAEYRATRQSLSESGKPNFSLEIERVDAYHLGQLFQLMELSIACLGELFEINAFDQPGVERGKILTKEILEKER